MNRAESVAAPPARPLLIYDGDCRFCALWIHRWRQTTGDCVDYAPFQDSGVAARFPEVPRAQFELAVQLIEPDGRVFSAAQAVLRARAKAPGRRWLLQSYERWPIVARAAEGCYRLVAGHRPLFSALTRLLYGGHVELPQNRLARDIFLRGLGIIYLIAFISLWSQISGLVGSKGILPADQFMAAVTRECEDQSIGMSRYFQLPTLCWLSTSDGFLNFQCGAGVVVALLITAGVASRQGLCVAWLLYLSLCTVGRDFLAFQWDILLLEAGFLGIFFAPWSWWPRSSGAAPPSRTLLFLLRWLLFRLMFESGSVKLLSGDEMWRNLSALTVHYETQPLPTWLSWYAHQLPGWCHTASVVVMFGIELVIPFLYFAPRRPRMFAAWVTIALQFGILITGNYTFFNWLTLLLCVTLFDDFALKKVFPGRRRSELGTPGPELTRPPAPLWRALVIPLLAIVVLVISGAQLLTMFRILQAAPAPLRTLQAWVGPFRSINRYGLFAVMTPAPRPEIIVEGSQDGRIWRAYEFRYKPGDVKTRPGFVAPHQPRLDWQMWFAALGDYRQNPWFVNFCVRLLEGSPDVLALLRSNPFPETPPRFVRATLYDYRFTDIAMRSQTGQWWRREWRREYSPVMSLRVDKKE